MLTGEDMVERCSRGEDKVKVGASAMEESVHGTVSRRLLIG
jgi:hypothetical protein